MNPTQDRLDAPAEDDPRLLRAAQTYLAAVEAGQPPTHAEFVARFPDLGDELIPYLDAIDMVHPVPLQVSSLRRSNADDSLPPEPLGDFRIVREIGRGGMGIVYEAVQLSLGRRVALKVLSFAAALDGKQLERFKNKAQAAAHLHHTNIVPVYAVGSERGVHYYAMQLIEGQNLAELICQVRPRTEAAGVNLGSTSPAAPVSPDSGAIRGAPEPTGPPQTLLRASRGADAVTAVGMELSTQRATRSADFYRTAARLIVQAAEALEHAHQLGVIHRDVKPANLLIDGRGHIWVTDFGLAQFHSSLALTRTGDLMGTLRYMSPEQAGGQHLPIDPRTDVYSLGATFYELLTLEPLFDGGDHRRLLRQILDEEPRPPRSVDSSVPPELETIVLKAVSKSLSDRYATAQEFADDLRRFLDNRPILARRPTPVERLRKWARRHPSVVAASVVVLLLVSVVSLGCAAVVFGEKAKTEAAYKLILDEKAKTLDEKAKTQTAYERAAAAATREQRRAEEAEARLRLARRSVAELFQVSEEELADKPGTERLRRRVLESVLIYHQELLEQEGDDPKAREQLHQMKAQVEQILADLVVLQAAEQLSLLNQPDVLADLRLNQEQQTKVKNLLGKINKQREKGGADLGRLSPDERRLRDVDWARANDAEVRGILGKEQLRRLPQIALQVRRTGAFREADVAAALKLTPDQRERIRKIDDEVFWAGRTTDKRGPGGGPDQRKNDDQKRKEEALQQKRIEEGVQRIVALLTPEQAQLWKEMTGERFKGTVQPFGHGPPGSPH